MVTYAVLAENGRWRTRLLRAMPDEMIIIFDDIMVVVRGSLPGFELSRISFEKRHLEDKNVPQPQFARS